MKMKHVLAAAALAVSSLSYADLSNLPAGQYKVDPNHGYILMSYSHFGLSKPQIGFNSFDATIDLTPADPRESAVEVSIDPDSIDSRVDEFDGHLKGENFFDTANYPDITFSATAIEKTEDGYEVSGDLTIKGNTRPVTLRADIVAVEEHPFQKVPAIGVSATADLLRSDFGLGAYAPAVSDEVTLTIEAEFLLK